MSKPHEHWDFGLETANPKPKIVPEPLRYNPTHIKRTYGVLLHTEVNGVTNHIHYHIDVMCVAHQPDNHTIFEVYKNPPFINETAPHTVTQQLAWACGSVLYPLRIKTNRFGKAVTLINTDDIKERWAIQRDRIQKSYKSEAISFLISEMDHRVANPEVLIPIVLENDWFINLFFKPWATAEDECTYQWAVPIIPYTAPIPFEIQQQLRYGKINTKDRIITQQGSIPNSNSTIAKAKLSLKHQFYNGSCVADTITAHCMYTDIETDYNTHIKIYNQTQAKPKTAAEKDKEKQQQLAQLENKLKEQLNPGLWKRLQNTVTKYHMNLSKPTQS